MRNVVTCLVPCVVLLRVPVRGQTKHATGEIPVDPLAPPQLKPLPEAVIRTAFGRDWCSTTWAAGELTTNAVTGVITGSGGPGYVEVADGMNYLDEGGSWRPSVDIIEATSSGAAALRGPTKVRFANNLNSEGAISLTTRSNKVMSLRPFGLFYYSPETGESVQIAQIQDCEGEIVPPNTVVFRSVFDSVRANLRLVWRKGTFESFLELCEAIPAPEEFSLPAESSAF